MRLRLVHFFAFTLILHGAAAASGVRITDSEKRALWAQGFDGLNVSASHHPQIVTGRFRLPEKPWLIARRWAPPTR